MSNKQIKVYTNMDGEFNGCENCKHITMTPYSSPSGTCVITNARCGVGFVCNFWEFNERLRKLSEYYCPENRKMYNFDEEE